MARPLKRRAAERARRALGVESLQARLDSIEVQIASQARQPAGPVYLGDHLALVATRWGAKMVVDTTDRLLAPWLLLDGLWESHVTGWMHDTLQPGQVMVDLGANVGYFTVLAAKRVGDSGRVVAVEAHPGVFDVLRRNVVMNGYRSTVTLHNLAAWSGPGQVQLHRRQRYAANSSLASAGADNLGELGDSEQVVTVESVAVDDLLAGAGRVDVVKVDIEGAEVHAFQGMARTLASNPEVAVMFEWSPEQIRLMGDDPKDLLVLLGDAGFGFRLMEEDLAVVDAARLLDLPYGNVVARR